MKLGTTTWRKRNTAKLERTKKAAIELGITEPILIEYGPGGAVKSMLAQMPEGSKQEWSTWVKMRRDFVKVSESILRKTQLFTLESSEPEEILELFKDLSPKRFHVIDKEQKVLEAVKRLVAKHEFTVPFEYHRLDLNHDVFQEQGDIVIAFNVAQRTKDPEASLRKITQSTRIGGLCTIGSDTTPEGFEKVGHGVYRRVK